MRIFVAAEVPAALASALDPCASGLPAARWRAVPSAQRHFTLRFLGEQPADAVGTVRRALEAACAGHRPFPLDVRGVGAFPSWSRAQVVWAGAGDGADGLARLAADVERDLVRAGLPAADRQFRAHLTLARRRPRASPDLAAADAAALRDAWSDRPWGRMEVRAVTLFRSELGPAGARYTPLTRAALAPRAAEEIP